MEFAGYNQVLAGSADRILKMAEEANTVQNDSLQRATKSEMRLAYIGQAIALVLAGSAFVVSAVFFWNDKPLAGVVFILIPIMMVIRSSGRDSDSEE